MNNLDPVNQNSLTNTLAGTLPPISEPVAPLQTSPEQINGLTSDTKPTSIDITPIETKSEVSESSGSYQPVSAGLDNPIFVAPLSVSAPVTTPMGTLTSSDATEMTVKTDIVNSSEVENDQQLTKTKKSVSPIMIGLFSIVFLGIAGAGVYSVARVVSTKTAISPTAPESEPQAFEPTPTMPTEVFNPDGTADCSGKPNTAPFANQCRPTVTDEFGNISWLIETVTPEMSPKISAQ